MTNWLSMGSGCPVKPFGDHRQVDIGRGGHDGKADKVFAAAAGAPGELLDFADRQIGKVPGLADARLRDDDRAGGKIDACRKGRRGEDRVETAVAHQLFDRDFPGRQMSGMMRRDADALHGCKQGMFGDARVLLNDLLQNIADLLLPRRRKHELAVFKGLHGLVAGATRGQKHDGRGQMFIAESRDQINRMDRRRHAASFPLR